MKKSLLWLVLLFMSAFLQMCTDEGEPFAPEKIQFTCVLTSLDNTGGRVQNVDVPASLLISLENNAGAPVITLKELKLLRVGDSFMTEPMELTPGYYKIVDFLLVTDSNKVLYATPKRGSTLAKAVVNPLPYGISVNKNRVSNIEMEVIDVTQQIPEDFGYTSFLINTVNPLKLSVFTVGDQGYSLSASTVRILKDDAVVKSWSLPAGINLISFPGNSEDTFLLEVEREGYTTYRKRFVYSELISSLNNLPLKVYLVPSLFTMLAYVDEEYSTFRFGFEIRLHGESGTINVDWGDGSHEVFELSIVGIDLIHQYSAKGNYSINVTGDIQNITSFHSFYGIGRMDAINVQGLSALKEFTIGLSRSPRVIDLTHNTNLISVWLPAALNLEELQLPESAIFTNISISGPTKLTVGAVDQIINDVYQSVLDNSRSGNLTLSSNWIPEDVTLLGPPSAASLIKLYELRDNYAWVIYPDL